MTRPFIALGSVPRKESPTKFGEPEFRLNVLRQCEAYIQAIRNFVGREPEGAELECKVFDGDRGMYYEVVCTYDQTNVEAEAYALRCERDGPHTWSEGSIMPPARVAGRSRVH
jgi:hypothetical protein